MNNNTNITNIILNNKKKILSKKDNYLSNSSKEKYTPISSHCSQKEHIMKLQEAYTLIKNDNNIQILESKFHMIWTKENIILI